MLHNRDGTIQSYTGVICLTETSSSNLIAATVFSSIAPCSANLSSAAAGSAVLLLFSLTWCC
jgi:hypothetical protein